MKITKKEFSELYQLGILQGLQIIFMDEKYYSVSLLLADSRGGVTAYDLLDTRHDLPRRFRSIDSAVKIIGECTQGFDFNFRVELFL
jgi:hypothetical protein